MATRTISETVNLANGEGIALHEFTTANGDIVLVKFHFFATSADGIHYDVAGTWEIAGGTGRFDGGTGGGSYNGLVVFDSATTAAGDFELTGTISSVGNSK